MEALPEWSRRTLTAHAADPRPSALPLATLEAAATGDRVWDSMQACLVRHGELHNNLRMTWGKARSLPASRQALHSTRLAGSARGAQ